MLASTSDDDTLILWDVDSDSSSFGQPLGPSLSSHAAVGPVALRPDGKMLALGTSDGTVILWDVATRQPLGPPLTGHPIVWTLAFSPDGKILASGGSDATIILWDVSLESWQARACRRANRNLTLEE